MNNGLVPNWAMCTRLYIVTLFIYLICAGHHEKCQAGWITSWNPHWQWKYQQPQVCRCYHFKGRNWGGPKELLDEGEIGEWKSWLETQHLKKLRCWHLLPSLAWQTEGESLETVTDFIFNFTADGDSSHEVIRCLLLGRKPMTNLKNVFKSRHITCQQRSIESKLWYFQ